MTTKAVGLDFGTTNSSIAAVNSDNHVSMVQFPYSSGTTETYRSLLYFERERKDGRSIVNTWSGPLAVDQYLRAEEKGRLIQSLKSYLASRDLKGTRVFGRPFMLEDLIAIILGDIRKEAEHRIGQRIARVVVGRPVRFAGSKSQEDDSYALSRIEMALDKAGFENVSFELEPVGAAYHYESTLDHDELILIGDFGGGTSDFSLLRVGPSVRRNGRSTNDLFGNEGIGIAGDAFDAKVIRHLVSPALGSESTLLSFNKVLPVPRWPYFRLEQWHHLSFLKTHDVMNTLRSIRAQALEPGKIEALMQLIWHDLGYLLHAAVQRLKCALSISECAIFRFTEMDIHLEVQVSRADFEGWISDELAAIDRCIDRLMTTTGINPKDVDRVFLTGGSSFVPAVRRLFEARFGLERISSGNEFTSVARGLALRCHSLQ